MARSRGLGDVYKRQQQQREPGSLGEQMVRSVLVLRLEVKVVVVPVLIHSKIT
jgi:hypothetical protein